MQRLKQQPGGDSSSSASTRSAGWYAGAAAAAAAAAAGAAAWSYDTSSSSAPPINASHLANASPRAQAAVAASLAGPLLHLQHGLNPSTAQLQGIAAALEADAAALGPELATGLWGLAMLGAVLPQQQLTRLAAAVGEQMQQMPVYEAIVAAWAISLLCTSTSTSSTSTSSSTAVSRAAWQQLMQRLQAASHREIKGDEAALLYLLHAAMQQAATAGVAGARGPTSAAPAAPASSSSRSSSESDSSGSSSGSGSAPQVWRTAAATETPHASLHEVMQQVQPLPAKLQRRLAAVYQEFVPFQPHVEGRLLVVLQIAKTLPRCIAATAAAAAADGGGSSSSSSPLVAVFGGLSGPDAQAAARRTGDPASLGKLKRDLYFRWRADALLDRNQQAVNQVAHVLYRRMQLQVRQGSDADVVLPTLKAAVFVVDDSHTQPGGQLGLPSQPVGTSSSRSSSSIVMPMMSNRSVAAAAATTTSTSCPPSPFTPTYWLEAHVGLQQLVRNRYSAPPGGFACRDCTGIAQAKLHCLRQRGWSVVVLQQSEVEAALGGFKAGRVRVGESYDYAGLEQMLRASLDPL